MRYKAKQYANALYSVGKEARPEKRKDMIGNFLALVRKNRDLKKLPLILSEMDNLYLEEHKHCRVKIESPEGVSEALKKKIAETLPLTPIWQEMVVPELLAGVRLTINDTILIDGSGKKRLASIFQQ